jgi:hypothetical protein
MTAPFAYHDLTRNGAAGSGRDFRDIAEDFSYAPFDLEADPLIRVLLARLADKTYGLVVCAEHIVCDGWSMGVITDELSRAYRSIQRGEPPLGRDGALLQFPDYVQWQRERVQGQLLDTAIENWRRRLAGLNPAPRISFPFSHSAAPGELRQKAGTTVQRAGANLVRQIAALCRETRYTPFTIFVAAIQALVHRYAGLAESVVVSPVAGRNVSGSIASVGWYATRVPLISRAKARATIAEVLEQAARASADARRTQDAPYACVVAALGAPDAVEGVAYHGDVLVNLIPPTLENRFAASAIEAATVTPFDIPAREPRATLAFTVTLAETSISVSLRYDLAQIAPAVARTVLDDYFIALAHIATRPWDRMVAIELKAAA